MTSHLQRLLSVSIGLIFCMQPYPLLATDTATSNPSPAQAAPAAKMLEKMRGTWLFAGGACMAPQTKAPSLEHFGKMGIYIRKMIVDKNSVSFITKYDKVGADCRQEVKTTGRFETLIENQNHATLKFKGEKFGNCRALSDKGDYTIKNTGDSEYLGSSSAEWYFDKDFLIRKMVLDKDSMINYCPDGKVFFEIWEADPST